MGADAQAIWDRTAGTYARQERLEHRAVRRALDLLAPGPDEALLDVATGTGLVLRELAARPAPPNAVIGLDRSAGMLAEVGPLRSGWRTVRGDATALPFENARFDVAISSYLLHLLDAPERRVVLGELLRVVRPGGRLVVVTVWSPRAAVRALFGGLARSSERAFGGLTPQDPRGDLQAAGWRLRRADVLHRGYPSLVMLAEQPRPTRSAG
ncbi:MAG: methyltransferase domain-containing protein [Solirubrobacterales bacterium]|nr:methyltransferase domain-containing protein [Solirubrobacterales bacterium]